MKTLLKCNTFEKKLINFCDYITNEIISDTDALIKDLHTNSVITRSNTIKNIRRIGINNDLSDVVVLVNPHREVGIKSYIDPLLLKSLLEDDDCEINKDNYYNFLLIIMSLDKWINNQNDVRDANLYDDMFNNITSKKYVFSDDIVNTDITESKFNSEFISKYLYSTLVQSLKLDKICSDIFGCGQDVSSKLVNETKIGMVHATSISSIIMSFTAILNAVYEDNFVILNYGVEIFNFLNSMAYNSIVVPKWSNYMDFLITAGKIKPADKETVTSIVDKWRTIIGHSNLINFASKKKLVDTYKTGVNTIIPTFDISKLDSLNSKLQAANNYLDVYFGRIIVSSDEEIKNALSSESKFLVTNNDNGFITLYSSNNSKVTNYFNSFTEFTDDKRVGTIRNSFALTGISHLQFDGFRVPIKAALFRNPKLVKIGNDLFSNFFSNYDSILENALVDEIGLDNTINDIPVFLDDLLTSGKFKLCHQDDTNLIIYRELGEFSNNSIEIITNNWSFKKRLLTADGPKLNVVWTNIATFNKSTDDGMFTLTTNNKLKVADGKMFVAIEVNKFINNDVLSIINNKETALINEYINVYNINNKKDSIDQNDVNINDKNSIIISQLDDKLVNFSKSNLRALVNFLLRNYRDEFISLIKQSNGVKAITKEVKDKLNDYNISITYDKLFADKYEQDEMDDFTKFVSKCFAKLVIGHNKSVSGIMPIPTYFREQYILELIKELNKNNKLNDDDKSSLKNELIKIDKTIKYDPKRISELLPFDDNEQCSMDACLSMHSSTIYNMKQKIKAMYKNFIISCIKELNNAFIITPVEYLHSGFMYEYTYNEYLSELSDSVGTNLTDDDKLLNYVIYSIGPKLLLTNQLNDGDISYIKSINEDILPNNHTDDTLKEKIKELLEKSKASSKFANLYNITGRKNWITLIEDYSTVIKAMFNCFGVDFQLISNIFDRRTDNVIKDIITEYIVLSK